MSKPGGDNPLTNKRLPPAVRHYLAVMKEIPARGITGVFPIASIVPSAGGCHADAGNPDRILSAVDCGRRKSFSPPFAIRT